jgi:hypothetical protein
VFKTTYTSSSSTFDPDPPTTVSGLLYFVDSDGDGLTLDTWSSGTDPCVFDIYKKKVQCGISSYDIIPFFDTFKKEVDYNS